MYKKFKYTAVVFAIAAVSILMNLQIEVFAAEGSTTEYLTSFKGLITTVITVAVACLLYNFLKKIGKK